MVSENGIKAQIFYRLLQTIFSYNQTSSSTKLDYGFVDMKNKIHIKGRIPKATEEIPTFIVNDEALKDQVNILSAVTVNTKGKFVIHFGKMPESKLDSETIMKSTLGIRRTGRKKS